MRNKYLTNPVLNLVMTGSVLFIFSCAGKPAKTTVEDIKYVESKALIEDKAKNSSNSASIDLFYQQNRTLRMEVTAVMGYRLGSLVMDPQKVAYALHPQKAFVEGPFIGRTMRPLFRQDLDPKLIWAVVFDRDLRGLGFNCSNNDKTQTCTGSGATEGVSVIIQMVGDNKPEPLKKITIENANLKFVWLYKSIRKHNKSYNETFVLNRPEDYRLITIK